VGFSEFLRLRAVTHISRVNCAEVAGDRPRQLAHEFSALNVDFNRLSCDLLGSRSAAYGSLKFGYSFRTHAMHWFSKWQYRCCRMSRELFSNYLFKKKFARQGNRL